MYFGETLISTTSTLEGFEITEYLGPVSVHMVAGTNLLSDLLASFTDVVGGRSSNYGRQLSSLYQDAVDQLQAEAAKLGADGVVGLSIDFDELNAQGKSMFMLNAVGTAVRLVQSAERRPREVDALSGTELSRLMYRQSLVDAMRTGKLHVSPDIVRYATRHRVHEVGPAILASAVPGWATGTDRASVLRYFEALPDEVSRDVLYGAIAVPENHPEVAATARAILVELHLTDLARVLRLLASGDRRLQVEGVLTLCAKQRAYSAEDIPTLMEVRQALDGVTSRYRPAVARAGLFRQGEKEVWECECGSTVVSPTETCPGCYRDQYGFPVGDFDLPRAKAEVAAQIRALSSLFPPAAEPA